MTKDRVVAGGLIVNREFVHADQLARRGPLGYIVLDLSSAVPISWAELQRAASGLLL
jgi:hypothetical protein